MQSIHRQSLYSLSPIAKAALSEWIQQELSHKSLLALSKELGMSYDRIKFCQLHLISTFSQQDIANIASYRGEPETEIQQWLGINS